jgi:hypothetical protein
MQVRLPTLLLLAAILLFAAGGAVEHQRHARLLKERQALEQQLQQIAQNTDANDLLPSDPQPAPGQSLSDNQFRELLRLRGRVSLLRQQTSDLSAGREENQRARAALEATRAAKASATADFWPKEAWSFTGYATPDAALQTTFWAGHNGDFNALTNALTGEMQDTVTKEFEGKSLTEASIRAMDETASLKSVRILKREPQPDGSLRLQAQMENNDGNVETIAFLLQQVGNDWKLARVGSADSQAQVPKLQ